ncbi:LysE family transporter [Megasphaera cerevisiae]|jgi:threonine/homoserine/homoserine lactone efflux protein|nr:LysE family transporter [Megasphaera cerevisiae]SJZ49707.1 Threonine/homoserine/homoserine lactone efflux protein [Megasphaera cerevisiae DSM 20462]
MMFNWWLFLSYAIVTAVTPGPNNLMSLSNAARFGFRNSFPFNLGIWAGFSLVMIVCTFFCNTLSSLLPAVELPMLIAGAAYLLWLSWKTFQCSSLTEADSSGHGFGSGLVLQFINPKIYIYGIVSMEAYILPYYQGQWESLFFFAMLLAFIGFVFTLGWALFGSMFTFLFSRHARMTNTIMSMLLGYCAISLFL